MITSAKPSCGAHRSGTRSASSDWPAGPAASFFMDRLAAAFQAELQTFTEVVAGERPSPCTVDDALAVTWMAEAATLSRTAGRPVDLAEVRA